MRAVCWEGEAPSPFLIDPSGAAELVQLAAARCTRSTPTHHALRALRVYTVHPSAAAAPEPRGARHSRLAARALRPPTSPRPAISQLAPTPPTCPLVPPAVSLLYPCCTLLRLSLTTSFQKDVGPDQKARNLLQLFLPFIYRCISGCLPTRRRRKSYRFPTDPVYGADRPPKGFAGRQRSEIILQTVRIRVGIARVQRD